MPVLWCWIQIATISLDRKINVRPEVWNCSHVIDNFLCKYSFKKVVCLLIRNFTSQAYISK